MSASNQDLRATVRDLLRREWDPIGVFGFDGAEDEYDSYVADVLRLIEKNATADEIFKFLSWVEVDHMGLPGNPARTKQIADNLHNLALKPSPRL
jgi:hypothetical protein